VLFAVVEYEKELNCVAVPYLYKGRILAVIVVAGPAFRFTKSDMIKLGEKIKVLFISK